MPKSYVEEVAIRYLKKKGYLVLEGIWFKLKKEKTGKKVSGWSDIDIFAVKCGAPPLIIQCKSFSGTKKWEDVVEKVVKWFEFAEGYLKDSPYKDWVKGKEYKKVFIVDVSVKKIDKKLKEKGIEVWYYKDILKKLLVELKEEQSKLDRGRIGKEEDVLLRILSDMLRQNLINKKKIK